MTLSNAFASGAVVADDEVPLVLLLLVPLVPPLPPPPAPPEASTPTTLNVTVNGSLFGLLNFRFRLDEISPPVNMLSEPTSAL